MSEYQLPASATTPSAYTFDTPHLLLAIRIGEDGFAIMTVREGAARQVELLTRIDYSFEPVDEHAQVFAVRATNQITFAGQRLSVLNDALQYGDTVLAPSHPTAAEYLALRGQLVMLRFDCARDSMESQQAGRPVFKTVRSSILLP